MGARDLGSHYEGPGALGQGLARWDLRIIYSVGCMIPKPNVVLYERFLGLEARASTNVKVPFPTR